MVGDGRLSAGKSTGHIRRKKNSFYHSKICFLTLDDALYAHNHSTADSKLQALNDVDMWICFGVYTLTI